MDVLPHIGSPCRVVSAPIASMLPQSSIIKTLSRSSCLMKAGSFCILLHPFIFKKLRLFDNRPIDLGSFLMGQHSMISLPSSVSAPKFLGSLFKLSQRLSSSSLSTLRSQIEFGRECSRSQEILNFQRHSKSPMDSGSSVRLRLSISRYSRLCNAP